VRYNGGHGQRCPDRWPSSHDHAPTVSKALTGYPLYQAASWTKLRRVVAKVELHLGEVFPRVGFIVTNLETDSRAVVRFYNKLDTVEQWIKEGSRRIIMPRRKAEIGNSRSTVRRAELVGKAGVAVKLLDRPRTALIGRKPCRLSCMGSRGGATPWPAA
jgi:hypothetical protein